MPPHGHGHHGHGHGHRHRGGRGFVGGGPWWGPGYGSWWDPTPNTELVVVDDGDRERERRIMAHIMTLPKAQRAAAYMRLFGKPAGPGELGGLFEVATNPWFLLIGGFVAWKLWLAPKQKRRRQRDYDAGKALRRRELDDARRRLEYEEEAGRLGLRRRR